MRNIQQEINKRFLLQKEFLGEQKTINKVSPLVSIQVQTYQHVAFIKQCLESILMQKTTFEYEIIIGEDESTDGTREICKEYAEKYTNKIRLFLRDREISHLHDGDGNFIKRLNGVFCRMSARGKYIALCEGDDYWTDPYKLQKQVDFLEANHDFAICFHNSRVIDESNLIEHLLCQSEQKEVTTIEDIIQSNYIPTASVVFRNSDLMKQLPEWFYKLPIGDWPLHILNAQYGKIKYIPEVMSVYRKHSNSVWSSKKWVYQIETVLKVLDTINKHFNGYYNNIINKKIYDEISWRFKLAMNSFRNKEYEAAYEYLNELQKVVPLNNYVKYGMIITLFNLDKINEAKKELIEFRKPNKEGLEMDKCIIESGLELPTNFVEEKDFLRNKLKEIMEDLDPMNIANSKSEYSLISNFNTYKLLEGNEFVPEVWNIDYLGNRKQSIFAHANSRIYYQIPVPHKGIFEFGIMMHQDMWEKDEAVGGCSFQVIVDDRISFEFVLDPVAIPNDRCQFNFKLDIPHNNNGNHEVLLETKTLGRNNNYRWALWLQPTFYSENSEKIGKNKNENFQTPSWDSGIENEIRFWKDWILNSGGRWKENFTFRLDPDAQLQEYIAKLLPSNKNEIKILDVGSGPITSLGKKVEGKNIIITAVDPLAVEYNKLLDSYNINPPVRTEFVKAEELTMTLSPESFDLVYARNSIDHSENPFVSLEQMIQMAKKDGIILLEHAVNEAENENYEGFHQWNFTSENDRFIIWNKQNHIDVNEKLDAIASIETIINKEKTWMKIIIRRK